ncbi:hypothetical protein MLD38_011608 [Melastoma candidum]|nr:hypothetical protein MLD38_011608 [Melastoma candidum]
MSKVRQYAASYEKMGWTKVISSLSKGCEGKTMGRDDARKSFERFNLSFEEAYRKQSTWVVTDPKLREELKVSLGRNVLGRYYEFYQAHGTALREETYGEGIVRYAPEDVGNYLSDLFYGGNGGPGGISSSRTTMSSSSSSGSGSGSWPLRHLGIGKSR